MILIYIDIFFSLTIGIGGVNEGFLFLLQLQDGWTGGTDSYHLNFRMDVGTRVNGPLFLPMP